MVLMGLDRDIHQNEWSVCLNWDIRVVLPLESIPSTAIIGIIVIPHSEFTFGIEPGYYAPRFYIVNT